LALGRLLIFVKAGNKERQRRSSGIKKHMQYCIAGTSLRSFTAYMLGFLRESTDR